jgi:hypothetical protein
MLKKDLQDWLKDSKNRDLLSQLVMDGKSYKDRHDWRKWPGLKKYEKSVIAEWQPKGSYPAQALVRRGSRYYQAIKSSKNVDPAAKKQVSWRLLGARNPEGIFSEVFAENGDKAAPPFAIDEGFTPNYEVPVSAGGSAPERTSFNFFFNQLYALGVDVNQMGAALAWNATITYDIGALVTGTNNKLYNAIASSTGVDPVTDGGANWALKPDYADLGNQTAGTEGSRRIGWTNTTVYNALTAGNAAIQNLQAQINTINGTLGSLQNQINTINNTINIERGRIIAGGYVNSAGQLIVGRNVVQTQRLAAGVFLLEWAPAASNQLWGFNFVADTTANTVVYARTTQRQPGSVVIGVNNSGTGQGSDIDFAFSIVDFTYQ